jgi:glycosyltransferase involved in cell wall biosynthesis
MRILFLTRDDPYEALTGVAVYVRDLATALVREGYEVAHLYLDSRPRRFSSSLRRQMRNGIPATVAAAPPISRMSLADSLRADVASPALVRILEDAVEEIQPDILHLHDVSGIPAALIPATKTRGCPVVVTLHDFWPLCRRLLLIRPDLVPCGGSGGGWNCARYCSGRPPLARRLLQQAGVIAPARLHSHLRGALGLYRRIRGRPHSQFVVRRSPPPHQVKAQGIVQAYALREALMRDALREADCIMTPSQFAKEVYLRHGYPAERIRVLPLSLLSFDRVVRRVRSFRGYPVRFGYLGRVTPWKGAHVLAEAIRGLQPGVAQFTFYGDVEGEDRLYLTSLGGGHPDLRFAGRYNHAELGRIMDELDVAIFPSLVSETLGLVGVEAQAAGVPVIGSSHAAIVEYVRHGVNGLLFPPGDAVSLRAQIMRVLQEPDLIARFSSRAACPPRMDWHVRELARTYTEAIRRAGSKVAPA